ncbi:MAG: CoA transferase [Pelagibacteraceae bacterium]|jgi:crotonobetainyl-CoA:carnitine CoA-transferase CaiB-like acyl-CoA transferase|nr:CoA transferase [Pelagibacteraceae bacterium]MBT3902158.1 CoA transferase [Pelagibacteraceae bacterium]MBT4646208.1 CoA transferase [Pelagibacteraceae bacterium]MBT4951161.1 CoA transferase [Pelagibacteraceae bacterium]MBT5214560.1 CoA transferase [Pelagibacteraceae bacterium]
MLNLSSALSDVKVLDFSHLLAGPFATQTLGDYGAEVYKIERIHVGDDFRRWNFFNKKVGNYSSASYMAWNRNKRSIALDIRKPEAKKIIYKMAESCDIVIQNFRPGVMAKRGYGYEDFKKINSKIIYCSGSGYGESGPYVNKPGQDLLLQGLTGLAKNTGRSSYPPTQLGAGIADQLGSLNMVIGILSALHYRNQTGKGQEIKVDLLSVLLQHQLQEFVAVLNLNQEFERPDSGVGHPGSGAPFGIYKTKDDYITIAVASLEDLSEILGDQDLKKYSQGPSGAMGSDLQITKRDEIFHYIENLTKKHTTEFLDKKLSEKGCWSAPLKTHKEVFDDPQVKHMNMFSTFSHPKYGNVKTVSPAVKMSETPTKISKPVPMIGEHGYEILKEFGYSEDEIKNFIKDEIMSLEK